MDFSVLLQDLREVAEKHRGKTTEPQVSTNAYVHLFTKILKRAQKVTDEYEDQITVLWVALNQLATIYKDLSPGQARDQLCTFVFGMCAKAVLNIQWPQLDEDCKAKKNFCVTLEAVHQIMAQEGFNKFQLVIDLMENPWTDPVLSKVMSGEEEEDTDDCMKYIQEQDPEILKLRIEIMIKESCEEFALNLCAWSLKHPQLGNDLEIKEFQIFILYKQKDYSKMQEVCETIVCHDGIKIMSHFAKTVSNQELCIRLAQVFLIQDWVQQERTCCTQELLKLWIHHQYLADKDEERFLDSIWTVAKVCRDTEQIGVLIDGVKRECGDMFIQLYTELCKFAINIDKGNIEKSQADGNLSDVKKRKLSMSKTCVRMAFMLKEYDFRISRICGLTAFTLDPTTDNLNLVNKLYWTIKNTSAVSKNSKIDIATVYEIERLLGQMRPDYLNPDFSWKQLIPVCKKYQQECDLKNSTQTVKQEHKPNSASTPSAIPPQQATTSQTGNQTNRITNKRLEREHLSKLLHEKNLPKEQIEKILNKQFPKSSSDDLCEGPALDMNKLGTTISALKKSINTESSFRESLEKNLSPLSQSTKPPAQSGVSKGSHLSGWSTGATSNMLHQHLTHGQTQQQGYSHFQQQRSPPVAHSQQQQMSTPVGTSGPLSPQAAHSNHGRLSNPNQPAIQPQSQQPSASKQTDRYHNMISEMVKQNNNQQASKQQKQQNVTPFNVLRPPGTANQECAKIAQQIAEMHEKQRADRERIEIARAQGKLDAAKAVLNANNIPNSSQISDLLSLTFQGNKVTTNQTAKLMASKLPIAALSLKDTKQKTYSAVNSGIASSDAQLHNKGKQKFCLASEKTIAKLKPDSLGRVSIGNSQFSVQPIATFTKANLVKTLTKAGQNLPCSTVQSQNLQQPTASVQRNALPPSSTQHLPLAPVQNLFGNSGHHQNTVSQHQQSASSNIKLANQPDLLTGLMVNSQGILQTSAYQNLDTLATASILDASQQGLCLTAIQTQQHQVQQPNAGTTVVDSGSLYPSSIQGGSQSVLGSQIYSASQSGLVADSGIVQPSQSIAMKVNQKPVERLVAVQNSVLDFSMQPSIVQNTGIMNTYQPLTNIQAGQPAVANYVTVSTDPPQQLAQQQVVNTDINAHVLQQIMTALKQVNTQQSAGNQQAVIHANQQQESYKTIPDSPQPADLLKQIVNTRPENVNDASVIEATRKIIELRDQLLQGGDQGKSTQGNRTPDDTTIRTDNKPSGILQQMMEDGQQSSAAAGHSAPQTVSEKTVPDLPDLGAKEFHIDEILSLENDSDTKTTPAMNVEVDLPGTVARLLNEADRQRSVPDTSTYANANRKAKERELVGKTKQNRSHLSSSQDNINSVNCQNCGRPFKTRGNLQKHLKFHCKFTKHQDGKIENAKIKANLQDKVKNFSIIQKTKGSELYQTNMSKVTNIESQKASIPIVQNTAFVEPSKVQRIPLISCQACNLHFRTENGLAEHQASCVCVLNQCKAVGNVKCDICNMTFKSLEDIKEHAKSGCAKGPVKYGNIKPNPSAGEPIRDFEYEILYRCPACHVFYSCEKVAYKHVESCTINLRKDKPEEMYRCFMCKQVFNNKERTSRHVSKFCHRLKSTSSQQRAQIMYDKIHSGESTYKIKQGPIDKGKESTMLKAQSPHNQCNAPATPKPLQSTVTKGSVPPIIHEVQKAQAEHTVPKTPEVTGHCEAHTPVLNQHPQHQKDASEFPSVIQKGIDVLPTEDTGRLKSSTDGLIETLNKNTPDGTVIEKLNLIKDDFKLHITDNIKQCSQQPYDKPVEEKDLQCDKDRVKQMLQTDNNSSKPNTVKTISLGTSFVDVKREHQRIEQQRSNKQTNVATEDKTGSLNTKPVTEPDEEKLETLKSLRKRSEILYWQEFNAIEKRKSHQRAKELEIKTSEVYSQAELSKQFKAQLEQDREAKLKKIQQEQREREEKCQEQLKNIHNIKVGKRIITIIDDETLKIVKEKKEGEDGKIVTDLEIIKAKNVEQQKITKGAENKLNEKKGSKKGIGLPVSSILQSRLRAPQDIRKQRGLREKRLIKKRKFFDELEPCILLAACQTKVKRLYSESDEVSDDDDVITKDKGKDESMCRFCDFQAKQQIQSRRTANLVRHYVHYHKIGYRALRHELLCKLCAFKTPATKCVQMHQHICEVHKMETYSNVQKGKFDLDTLNGIKRSSPKSSEKSHKRPIKGPHMKTEKLKRHLRAHALRSKCAEQLHKLSMEKKDTIVDVEEHGDDTCQTELEDLLPVKIEQVTIKVNEPQNQTDPKQSDDWKKIAYSPRLASRQTRRVVKSENKTSIKRSVSLLEEPEVSRDIQRSRSSSFSSTLSSMSSSNKVKTKGDSSSSGEIIMTTRSGRKIVKIVTESEEDASSSSDNSDQENEKKGNRRKSLRIRRLSDRSKNRMDQSSSLSEESSDEQVVPRITRSSIKKETIDRKDGLKQNNKKVDVLNRRVTQLRGRKYNKTSDHYDSDTESNDVDLNVSAKSSDTVQKQQPHVERKIIHKPKEEHKSRYDTKAKSIMIGPEEDIQEFHVPTSSSNNPIDRNESVTQGEAEAVQQKLIVIGPEDEVAASITLSESKTPCIKGAVDKAEKDSKDAIESEEVTTKADVKESIDGAQSNKLPTESGKSMMKTILDDDEFALLKTEVGEPSTSAGTSVSNKTDRLNSSGSAYDNEFLKFTENNALRRLNYNAKKKAGPMIESNNFMKLGDLMSSVKSADVDPTPGNKDKLDADLSDKNTFISCFAKFAKGEKIPLVRVKRLSDGDVAKVAQTKNEKKTLDVLEKYNIINCSIKLRRLSKDEIDLRTHKIAKRKNINNIIIIEDSDTDSEMTEDVKTKYVNVGMSTSEVRVNRVEMVGKTDIVEDMTELQMKNSPPHIVSKIGLQSTEKDSDKNDENGTVENKPESLLKIPENQDKGMSLVAAFCDLEQDVNPDNSSNSSVDKLYGKDSNVVEVLGDIQSVCHPETHSVISEVEIIEINNDNEQVDPTEPETIKVTLQPTLGFVEEAVHVKELALFTEVGNQPDAGKRKVDNIISENTTLVQDSTAVHQDLNDSCKQIDKRVLNPVLFDEITENEDNTQRTEPSDETDISTIEGNKCLPKDSVMNETKLEVEEANKESRSDKTNNMFHKFDAEDTETVLNKEPGTTNNAISSSKVVEDDVTCEDIVNTVISSLIVEVIKENGLTSKGNHRDVEQTINCIEMDKSDGNKSLNINMSTQESENIELNQPSDTPMPLVRENEMVEETNIAETVPEAFTEGKDMDESHVAAIQQASEVLVSTNNNQLNIETKTTRYSATKVDHTRNEVPAILTSSETLLSTSNSVDISPIGTLDTTGEFKSALEAAVSTSHTMPEEAKVQAGNLNTDNETPVSTYSNGDSITGTDQDSEAAVHLKRSDRDSEDEIMLISEESNLDSLPETETLKPEIAVSMSLSLKVLQDYNGSSDEAENTNEVPCKYEPINTDEAKYDIKVKDLKPEQSYNFAKESDGSEEELVLIEASETSTVEKSISSPKSMDIATVADNVEKGGQKILESSQSFETPAIAESSYCIEVKEDEKLVKVAEATVDKAFLSVDKNVEDHLVEKIGMPTDKTSISNSANNSLSHVKESLKILEMGIPQKDRPSTSHKLEMKNERVKDSHDSSIAVHGKVAVTQDFDPQFDTNEHVIESSCIALAETKVNTNQGLCSLSIIASEAQQSPDEILSTQKRKEGDEHKEVPTSVESDAVENEKVLRPKSKYTTDVGKVIEEHEQTSVAPKPISERVVDEEIPESDRITLDTVCEADDNSIEGVSAEESDDKKSQLNQACSESVQSEDEICIEKEKEKLQGNKGSEIEENSSGKDQVGATIERLTKVDHGAMFNMPKECITSKKQLVLEYVCSVPIETQVTDISDTSTSTFQQKIDIAPVGKPFISSLPDKSLTISDKISAVDINLTDHRSSVIKHFEDHSSNTSEKVTAETPGNKTDSFDYRNSVTMNKQLSDSKLKQTSEGNIHVVIENFSFDSEKLPPEQTSSSKQDNSTKDQDENNFPNELVNEVPEDEEQPCNHDTIVDIGNTPPAETTEIDANSSEKNSAVSETMTLDTEDHQEFTATVPDDVSEKLMLAETETQQHFEDHPPNRTEVITAETPVNKQDQDSLDDRNIVRTYKQPSDDKLEHTSEHNIHDVVEQISFDLENLPSEQASSSKQDSLIKDQDENMDKQPSDDKLKYTSEHNIHVVEQISFDLKDLPSEQASSSKQDSLIEDQDENKLVNEVPKGEKLSCNHDIIVEKVASVELWSTKQENTSNTPTTETTEIDANSSEKNSAVSETMTLETEDHQEVSATVPDDVSEKLMQAETEPKQQFEDQTRNRTEVIFVETPANKQYPLDDRNTVTLETQPSDNKLDHTSEGNIHVAEEISFDSENLPLEKESSIKQDNLIKDQDEIDFPSEAPEDATFFVEKVVSVWSTKQENASNTPPAETTEIDANSSEKNSSAVSETMSLETVDHQESAAIVLDDVSEKLMQAEAETNQHFQDHIPNRTEVIFVETPVNKQDSFDDGSTVTMQTQLSDDKVVKEISLDTEQPLSKQTNPSKHDDSIKEQDEDNFTNELVNQTHKVLDEEQFGESGLTLKQVDILVSDTPARTTEIDTNSSEKNSAAVSESKSLETVDYQESSITVLDDVFKNVIQAETETKQSNSNTDLLDLVQESENLEAIIIHDVGQAKYSGQEPDNDKETELSSITTASSDDSETLSLVMNVHKGHSKTENPDIEEQEQSKSVVEESNDEKETKQSILTVALSDVQKTVDTETVVHQDSVITNPSHVIQDEDQAKSNEQETSHEEEIMYSNSDALINVTQEIKTSETIDSQEFSITAQEVEQVQAIEPDSYEKIEITQKNTARLLNVDLETRTLKAINHQESLDAVQDNVTQEVEQARSSEQDMEENGTVQIVSTIVKLEDSQKNVTSEDTNKQESSMTVKDNVIQDIGQSESDEENNSNNITSTTAFFDAVLKSINCETIHNQESAVIIGDSVTSDVGCSKSKGEQRLDGEKEIESIIESGIFHIFKQLCQQVPAAVSFDVTVADFMIQEGINAADFQRKRLKTKGESSRVKTIAHVESEASGNKNSTSKLKTPKHNVQVTSLKQQPLVPGKNKSRNLVEVEQAVQEAIDVSKEIQQNMISFDITSKKSSSKVYEEVEVAGNDALEKVDHSETHEEKPRARDNIMLNKDSEDNDREIEDNAGDISVNVKRSSRLRNMQRMDYKQFSAGILDKDKNAQNDESSPKRRRISIDERANNVKLKGKSEEKEDAAGSQEKIDGVELISVPKTSVTSKPGNTNLKVDISKSAVRVITLKPNTDTISPEVQRENETDEEFKRRVENVRRVRRKSIVKPYESDFNFENPAANELNSASGKGIGKTAEVADTKIVTKGTMYKDKKVVTVPCPPPPKADEKIPKVITIVKNKNAEQKVSKIIPIPITKAVTLQTYTKGSVTRNQLLVSAERVPKSEAYPETPPQKTTISSLAMKLVNTIGSGKVKGISNQDFASRVVHTRSLSKEGEKVKVPSSDPHTFPTKMSPLEHNSYILRQGFGKKFQNNPRRIAKSGSVLPVSSPGKAETDNKQKSDQDKAKTQVHLRNSLRSTTTVSYPRNKTALEQDKTNAQASTRQSDRSTRAKMEGNQIIETSDTKKKSVDDKIPESDEAIITRSHGQTPDRMGDIKSPTDKQDSKVNVKKPSEKKDKKIDIKSPADRKDPKAEVKFPSEKKEVSKKMRTSTVVKEDNLDQTVTTESIPMETRTRRLSKDSSEGLRSRSQSNESIHATGMKPDNTNRQRRFSAQSNQENTRNVKGTSDKKSAGTVTKRKSVDPQPKEIKRQAVESRVTQKPTPVKLVSKVTNSTNKTTSKSTSVKDNEIIPNTEAKTDDNKTENTSKGPVDNSRKSIKRKADAIEASANDKTETDESDKVTAAKKHKTDRTDHNKSSETTRPMTRGKGTNKAVRQIIHGGKLIQIAKGSVTEFEIQGKTRSETAKNVEEAFGHDKPDNSKKAVKKVSVSDKRHSYSAINQYINTTLKSIAQGKNKNSGKNWTVDLHHKKSYSISYKKK